MLDMTRDTFKLVVENKLFKDPVVAYRQVAIGAVLTAAILIALAYGPIPLWISATVAGFLGGFAMPYLFRDIKFK
jgi:hypothetical protein